jgi:hypothetical protein
VADIILPQEAISMAASCTAAEAVGDAVYVTGSATVRRCDPYDPSKMPAIGVITAKPTTTSCVVVTSGRARLAGLTTGVAYFVQPNGAAAPGTPMMGPSHVWVQRIGRALAPNVLNVIIDPPTQRIP